MSQFCRIFRRAIQTSPVRFAPKPSRRARVQEAAAAEASPSTVSVEDSHIFNIFAHKKDIDPKSIEVPDWVNGLHRATLPSYNVLAQKFLYGQGIATATAAEYKRFRKLHRRILIKLNNMRLAQRTSRTPYQYKHV